MSSLRDSLAQFSVDDDEDQFQESTKKKSTAPSDYFDSPFDNSGDFFNTRVSSSNLFEKTRKMKEEGKRKKEEYDDNFSMMDSLNAELESALSDFTPFDKIADEMFSMDEDDELRMSLISQGRKYNQAHGQSAEASEIEKVFTKQEIALNQLIQDVDKDISAIERDLNQMRMARVRSPKGLSDLVSAKGSLHNTKLSAIKEINSMKRNIIDLNMKAKKGTEDESQANLAASMALQQIISGDTRDSLSDPELRNYARGSIPESDIPNYEFSAAEDFGEMDAEREYEANESEGDLYIKYENLGVQLYAQVDDEDKVVSIVARDKDGNEVPNYPLPETDFDHLTVHSDLGNVTDTFHRNYKLERI